MSPETFHFLSKLHRVGSFLLLPPPFPFSPPPGFLFYSYHPLLRPCLCLLLFPQRHFLPIFPRDSLAAPLAPDKSAMAAVSAPTPKLDRYIVIHVATTCDEHGVYVTKDSAEVIELGWILLDTKTCEEVRSPPTSLCPIFNLLPRPTRKLTPFFPNCLVAP